MMIYHSFVLPFLSFFFFDRAYQFFPTNRTTEYRNENFVLIEEHAKINMKKQSRKQNEKNLHNLS